MDEQRSLIGAPDWIRRPTSDGDAASPADAQSHYRPKGIAWDSGSVAAHDRSMASKGSYAPRFLAGLFDVTPDAIRHALNRQSAGPWTK